MPPPPSPSLAIHITGYHRAANALKHLQRYKDAVTTIERGLNKFGNNADFRKLYDEVPLPPASLAHHHAPPNAPTPLATRYHTAEGVVRRPGEEAARRHEGRREDQGGGQRPVQGAV